MSNDYKDDNLARIFSVLGMTIDDIENKLEKIKRNKLKLLTNVVYESNRFGKNLNNRTDKELSQDIQATILSMMFVQDYMSRHYWKRMGFELDDEKDSIDKPNDD